MCHLTNAVIAVWIGTNLSCQLIPAPTMGLRNDNVSSEQRCHCCMDRDKSVVSSDTSAFAKKIVGEL